MLTHSAWRDAENPPPNVQFSVIHTRQHSASVRSVAYSSDDTLFGIASGPDVHVYESASSRSISRLFVRRTNQISTTDPFNVRCITFATLPDQYHLYSDTSDSFSATHIEGNGPNNDDDRDFHMDLPTRCTFSNQGLLSAGTDGKVLLWNVRDARPLATLLQVEVPITSIAISNSMNLFVSGATDGRIHIRSVRCGASRGPSVEVPGGAGSITVAFSPTGTIVASGDCQGIAAAWDVESGRCMWTNNLNSPRRPRDSQPALSASVFSPDGRLLLTGAHDGSVNLYDLANCEEPIIRTFAVHPNSVHAIAFAPNGRWFISACADGVVRLWDPRFTSRVVETYFDSHRAPLLTVAHASRSKTFCAGDSDGTAHVCTYI